MRWDGEGGERMARQAMGRGAVRRARRRGDLAGPRRPLLFRWGVALGLVAVLVTAGFMAGSAIWQQSLAPATIRRHLMAPLTGIGLHVTAGRVEVSGLHRISLRGVQLTAVDGPAAGWTVGARQVVLEVDWRQWLNERRPSSAVTEIRVDGPSGVLPPEALGADFWNALAAYYRDRLRGTPLAGEAESAPARERSPTSGPQAPGETAPLTVRVQNARFRLGEEGTAFPVQGSAELRRVAAGGWRVTADLRRGDASLRAAGELRPALALAIQARDVALPRDIPAVAGWGVAGLMDFTGQMTGSLASPEVSGWATVTGGKVAGLAVDDAAGRLRIQPDQITFGESIIVRGGARYALAGHVSWGGDGGWEVRIEPEAGRIEDLLHVMGIGAPLRGEVSGGFDVRRAGTAVGAAGDLRLRQGEAWGQPFDHLAGRFNLQDEAIDIQIADGRAGAGRFAVAGLRGRFHWKADALSIREFAFHRTGKGPAGASAVAPGAPAATYTVRGSVQGAGPQDALNLAVTIQNEEPAGLLALGGLSVPAGLAGGLVEGNAAVNGSLSDPQATLDLFWRDPAGGDGLRLQLVYAAHRLRLRQLG